MIKEKKINRGITGIRIVLLGIFLAIFFSTVTVRAEGEGTSNNLQNGSFENGVVNCTSGWCCSGNVEWFKPNTEYTVITYVISISGTDSYLKVNDGS